MKIYSINIKINLSKKIFFNIKLGREQSDPRPVLKTITAPKEDYIDKANLTLSHLSGNGSVELRSIKIYSINIKTNLSKKICYNFSIILFN